MSGERRTIITPGRILKNNVILEQIKDDTGNRFAIKEGENPPRYDSKYELGEDLMFFPMSKCPWIPPSEALEYENDESLFREVRDFIHEHLDISKDERYYDLLSAWLLADWVQQKFIVAPYLHFHGSPNSGKSRGLEIIRALGFRCLLSPSISAAALYRTIEVLGPTFLIDEAELYTSQGLDETKREVLSVLNAGYRRGQMVIRADAKGQELKMFDVWGFKALGSVQTLPPTLAGRAHRIPMMRATRKVKTRIDNEQALELKNKLLMYRFNHLLDEPHEDVNPLNIPDGRLIEIFTPLVLVAPNDEIEETLVELGEGVYGTLIEEERTRPEAQVFFVINELMKKASGISELAINDIVEKYNEDKPKKEYLSHSYCGRLTKTLNFDKKRLGGSGKTAIVLDEQLIKRLRYRYGIVAEPTLDGVFVTTGTPWSDIKSWLASQPDKIRKVDLAAKAREVRLEPQDVVRDLKEKGLIFDLSGDVESWGVVHRDA